MTRRPLSGLLWPGLALLLAACTTLGPDFREPEADWLARWEANLHGLARTDDDTQGWQRSLAEWWQRFDDPVLERLIAAARKANPDLRIAALRMLESRAAQGIAKGYRYPQVQQFSAGATRIEQWGDGANRGDTLREAGFDVAWELDFWGRWQRGVEAADAAFLAAVENQRAAQVLINARVVELYFAFRVLQRRLEIARHNAEIQQRSFEIARALFESGNTSELDLQQARTQYLSTRATLPVLEQGLVQTRNALAALLGRPPGAVPELDEVPTTLPEPEPALVRDIPARLLLRRPDVRAATWQVAVQTARVGIAETDLYPAISLIGNLGWNGGEGPTLLTAAGGPALRWNLFHYGRLKNAVRVQDARLQQAIERWRDTVLRAAAEVDDAAIAVVRTHEQYRLLRETVTAAERALQLARTNYQEGYADFQRVLDAQRSLFTQQDRLIGVQGDALRAIITLYKGLGGGWQPMTTTEMLPRETLEEMRRRTDWGDLLRVSEPRTPAEEMPE